MFNVTAEPTASTDNMQHRSCQNCGVTGMTNGGICARCLKLPYCRRCKRHLPEGCFGDESNLCLVRSQFQLYIFYSRFLLLCCNWPPSHSLFSIRRQRQMCIRDSHDANRSVNNDSSICNVCFGHFLDVSIDGKMMITFR